jgi:predicted protein tyrosine phosphatase
MRTTKTDSIFNTTAPYDNYAQTRAARLLFVCSAGMLRSPTAANAATAQGYNARSCGTHKCALIPLSANLILWAQTIFFVNQENFGAALVTFDKDKYPELHSMLIEKSIVWNIEDQYNWGDNVLFHTCYDLIKKEFQT